MSNLPKCYHNCHNLKDYICIEPGCPFTKYYLFGPDDKLKTLKDVFDIAPPVKSLFKEEHTALMLVIAPKLIFADICLNKDGSYNSLLQNYNDPVWSMFRNEIKKKLPQ